MKGQRLLILSLLQVKVSSKTKHVVHFNVKAGDVIIWEFATKKRDIAFGEGMKWRVRIVVYCSISNTYSKKSLSP